jgi:anti-sigma regulatory factor (Ser/Thr protein kinase)
MLLESPGSFHRSFATDLNAPTAARRALEGLSGHVDDDLLERIVLLVTELVTNSVRHAGLRPGQSIDLQVFMRPELLRVEVSDDGHGFDAVAVKPEPARVSGGWGLWLLDQLTDRWGVDFSHSTRVWFELDGLSERAAI